MMLLVVFGVIATLIQVSTFVVYGNHDENDPSKKNRMLRLDANIFKLLSTQEPTRTSSFSAVGANKLDTDFRIVGGTVAPVGKYPFYVNTLRPILCGGTLIHPDIVLSAART